MACFRKYDDITFDYIHPEGKESVLWNKRHTLIFVYAGELLVEERMQQVTVKAGECIFIKRDTVISLIKKTVDNQPFQGIAWGLGYFFLQDFYRELDRSQRKHKRTCPGVNITKLTPTVHIHSLYISLKPYLAFNRKPSMQTLEIKSREAVYCLLMTEQDLYSSLFDRGYGANASFPFSIN